MLVLGCERLPTGPAAGRFAPPERGITLVDWTADGYGTSVATAALDALAATGANTVTVIVTAYQSGATAGELRSGDSRTPSVAAVQSILAEARRLGLRIALKPHVDLDGGAWRGTIAPPDPARWFQSYQSFIVPWAALAEAEGARQFVVGTELATTIEHAALWRETIAKVRAVFSGEIVYAASWDECARVPFWNALDLVGVDFYFPLTVRRDCGRLEILSGWQPWLERLHLLHEQTGRDILITEIGYRSVDGAGMRPFEFKNQAALDLGEQADLYWAALAATGGKSWIRGLSWWNWPADGSGGPLNRDYTPRGKPAAEVLRATWGSPS